ncbi:MAG: MerR family transcriptional regulator, partial [candidate division WOR-3 bacterium]
MKAQERVYDIEELCSLTGLTVRTIRYYIQMGVVAPPEGQKRGAYYTRHHLEQLLAVRRWRNSGVSLERIKELLQPIPPEG